MRALEDLIKAIETSDIKSNLETKQEEIDQDKNLMFLIKEIKSLQKKSLSNPSIEINQRLEDLTNKLFNNIIYQDFLIVSDEYNQLINEINQYLDKYIIDTTSINN